MSREIDCPVHGRRGVEWGLKSFEQPALLDSASQPPEEQHSDVISPRELRGIQSVQSVMRALSQISSVTQITQTEPFSQLDLKGIDILTQVEGIYDSIGIQVKSSQGAIYGFKKSLARRMGIPRSEINNWCLEHRLIILNGSIPEDSIIARFQEQLAFVKSKLANLQFYSSLK